MATDSRKMPSLGIVHSKKLDQFFTARTVDNFFYLLRLFKASPVAFLQQIECPIPKQVQTQPNIPLKLECVTMLNKQMSSLLKYKWAQISFTSWAGALVQWLREETHVLKVVGSNPSTKYWMDIFSHIVVVKIVMFVWKD